MSEREDERERAKKNKFDPYATVRSLPTLAIDSIIQSAKNEAIPHAYDFIDGERYLIVFKMQGRSARGAYTAVYSASETAKVMEQNVLIILNHQRICRFVDPKLVYGHFPLLRARHGKPAYIEIGNFEKGLHLNYVVSVDIEPYVRTFSPQMTCDFIQVKPIKDFQVRRTHDWAVQSLPSALNDPKDLIRDLVGGSKRRKRKTKRRRTRRR